MNRPSAVLFAVVAACGCALSASADTHLYQIDPTRSSLTWSESVGFPGIFGGPAALVPQAPGGDTTTYSGTIAVVFEPGTIRLVPGASIVASENGLWLPGVNANGDLDPNSPPQSGNYGLASSAVDVSECVAGFSMVPYGFWPLTLNGTTFSENGLQLLTEGSKLMSSAVSYPQETQTSLSSLIQMTNGQQGALDLAQKELTISVQLSIPTYFHYYYTTYWEDTVTLSGQIVAIGVPEPSALALAALSLAGLAASAWHRRRNR